MSTRRQSLCKSIAIAGLLAMLACGRSAQLHAAEHSPCSPAAWHSLETANFRILNYGTQQVSRETANACEALRERLTIQWMGRDSQSPDWTPKCDIVLHPSDDAYVREVGVGGRTTIASSLIDRKQGRIAIRRIDIKATQPNWLSGALGHELTHVVLADRFAGQALPRWIDEGIAILADPAEKQGGHLRDLKNAMASHDEFRIFELITLADYPPARRWAAFYGQSTSLVQYLVAQGGADRFFEFVDRSFELGYEPALHDVYHFGVAELERRWQADFKASATKVSAQKSTSRPATLLSSASVVPAHGLR